MTTVIVQHSVADYDVWRPIFDAHGNEREAHGGRLVEIYRGAEDRNALTVVMEFPSAGQAQSFATAPSLKEAMSRAGVTSAPQISYVERA